MPALRRRLFLPILLATAALTACERAPAPQTSTPEPAEATPAAPVPAVQVTRPSGEPVPPTPAREFQPPPARDDRLPLVRILALAQDRVPGEVITVDLDEDDDDGDPPTYELEILTPDGQVVEINLDARTGAILEVEED